MCPPLNMLYNLWWYQFDSISYHTIRNVYVKHPFLTWGPTGDGWLTVGIYPRHLPQPFSKKKCIGKHICFLIQEPTVADIGHSSRQLFFMYKILRHTFQYISDLEATFLALFIGLSITYTSSLGQEDLVCVVLTWNASCIVFQDKFDSDNQLCI